MEANVLSESRRRALQLALGWARQHRRCNVFQISPLPVAEFSGLFALSDAELRARGIEPRVAGPGDRFPCRVSLREARPGERALLLNYEHQKAQTPYRSSYAIFVIEGAEQAQLAPGELPPVFDKRPLAVRAFDSDGMLIAADMALGLEVKAVLERMLEDGTAAYLHVHNAMHGCYSARVDRV
jgi:hypothetical protein